jgi:hypothetical protein
MCQPDSGDLLLELGVDMCEDEYMIYSDIAELEDTIRRISHPLSIII